MFGKEAIKLATELDMYEDIRPFNVSIKMFIIRTLVISMSLSS